MKMSLNSLYELSRRTIIVNKIEEITLLWHNSTLAARTEKGIHFINYSHNLECLDKNIDFIETFIPNPTSSPASHLFAGNFVKNGMANMEYTEMILNPALWAHNTQMVKNFANVSVFEWSPVDFLQHNQCALAVLNNIGSVELYGQVRNKWINIFGLASYVNQVMKTPTVLPDNLNMLKQAAYDVHTSAICWAPTLVDENACYLATAQKNGDILFWLLKSDGTDINANSEGVIISETSEISTMLWVPLMQGKFILICCNIFGQILSFGCVFEKGKIKQTISQILWHHKDRMIAKCFKYITIENNSVIVYIKHRHIVLQLIDKNLTILSQYIKNVNDHRITCITVTNEGVYLTTINANIYKVNIKVLDQKLVVSLDPVENREPFTDHEVSSIGFSSNNLMCAIGMIERKVLCRKEPIKIDIVLMTTENKIEEVFAILLDNPTKRLTEYWDCIELLRYKTIKTNKMPLINYKQLYKEGQIEVYKMKIYLILLIIYNTLRKTARIYGFVSLPETCINTVTEQIICSQAIKVLNKLYEDKNLLNSNKFHKESFQGARRYLEFYCQKYSKNVSELVSTNILNLSIDCNPTYTCQCCDKRLGGFSCEDQHLNMFCSLSLTLIENVNEYLVCKNCSLTARRELFLDKPMCLICDLYLHVA